MDLEKHLYREQFNIKVKKKYNNLKKKNYQQEINLSEASRPVIPLKYIFIYKIDSKSYLLNYKVKLIVRSNKQYKDIIKSIYIAILTT